MLYALRMLQEPDDPRGYMARAVIRYQAGDVDGAVKIYRLATEAIPDFGAAWANLGALLLEQGKLEEAKQALLKGAANAPDHAGVFANLAAVLAVMDRYEEALAAAETAIELDDEDSDLRRNHAAILFKAQRYTEAERVLKRALAEFPDEAPDFLMRLSELYLEKGDDARAVVMLERVNSIAPSYPDAYLKRAALLGRQDDLNGALDALVEGLRHNPEDEDLQSFFAAAMALRLERDLQDGMERIEDNPRDVGAYVQVARVFELGREYRQALSVLSEGVTNNPGSPELWAHIGMVEASLKREREALAAYQRAVDLDPTLAAALNNYAYLLVTAEDAALRNPPLALTMARRALDLEPTNTSYLDTLAEVHFARGDVVAARQVIKRALQLEPRDPDLLAQAQRFEAALVDEQVEVGDEARDR